MSLKKTNSHCFVIDASIARAAGEFTSTHPIGSRCRSFLQSIRGVCHRMAWNDAIKAEWVKHESKFAKTWRVSMTSIGKTRTIDCATRAEFREAIAELAENEGAAKKMMDDAHLIEAALAVDRRIASLDETVRGHFGELSASCEDLRTIHQGVLLYAWF